jgi:hypothetical protein
MLLDLTLALMRRCPEVRVRACVRSCVCVCVWRRAQTLLFTIC